MHVCEKENKKEECMKEYETLKKKLTGNNIDDISNFLIKNRNCLFLRGKDGETCLHFAIDEKLDVEIIELLIKFGIDVNAADHSGDLPIHKLLKKQFNGSEKEYSKAILDIILDEGAVLDNRILELCEDGNVLHDRMRDQYNLMNNIFDKHNNYNPPKYSINYPNARFGKNKETLLHFSIRKFNKKLFSCLLNDPGINIELIDNKGMTPYDLAKSRSNRKNSGKDYQYFINILEKYTQYLTIRKEQKEHNYTCQRETHWREKYLQSQQQIQVLQNQLAKHDKDFREQLLEERNQEARTEPSLFQITRNLEHQNLATTLADLKFVVAERLALPEKEKMRDAFQHEGLLMLISNLESKLERFKSNTKESQLELQQQIKNIELILKPLKKVREVQTKIHEWLNQQDQGLKNMPFTTFYFATKNRLNNLFIGLAAITSGQVERKKSWKDISGECIFASLGIAASAVIAGVTLGPGTAFAPAIISGSLMLGKKTFDEYRETTKSTEKERAKAFFEDGKLGDYYLSRDFNIDISNQVFAFMATRLFYQQLEKCQAAGAINLAEAWVLGIAYAMAKQKRLSNSQRALLLNSEKKGFPKKPLHTQYDAFKHTDASGKPVGKKGKHVWSSTGVIHRSGLRYPCKEASDGFRYFSCKKNQDKQKYGIKAYKYGYRTLENQAEFDAYRIAKLERKFSYKVLTVDSDLNRIITDFAERQECRFLTIQMQMDSKIEFYKFSDGRYQPVEIDASFLPSQGFDSYEYHEAVVATLIQDYKDKTLTKKYKAYKQTFTWVQDKEPLGPLLLNIQDNPLHKRNLNNKNRKRQESSQKKAASTKTSIEKTKAQSSPSNMAQSPGQIWTVDRGQGERLTRLENENKKLKNKNKKIKNRLFKMELLVESMHMKKSDVRTPNTPFKIG